MIEPVEVTDLDLPLNDIDGIIPKRSKFIQFRMKELFMRRFCSVCGGKFEKWIFCKIKTAYYIGSNQYCTLQKFLGLSKYKYG